MAGIQFPRVRQHLIVMSEERQSAFLWEKTSYSGMPMENPLSGHIINISKRGMYIITDAPLNDGEEINANLLWKSLSSLTSLEGHIVRRGDNGVAVRFI